MVSTVERGLTTDWAWAELEFRSAGKGRGMGRDGIGWFRRELTTGLGTV